jgi:hypothetical protein
VRGASALQVVLAAHRDVPLRTFVVWEAVLRTDLRAPSTRKLALVHDDRAAQFWDRKRALADEMLRAWLAEPGRTLSVPGAGPVTEDTIVWDVALLFRPGATWGDDPLMVGAPVVAAADELDAALDAVQR